MDDQKIEAKVSNQIRAEYSEYDIKFESDRSLKSGDGCYVKYVFPDEIDISGVDLSDIKGKGMFADINGNS